MRSAAIVVAVAACRFLPGAALDAGSGSGSDAGMPDTPRDGSADDGCWAIWEHGTPRFSTPVEITGLIAGDTGFAFNERDPFISADELTLYFSSDADDGFAIYAATRGSAGGTFGSATQVSAIDVSDSESKITFTADGSIAIYASSDGDDDNLFESQVSGGVVQAGSMANLTQIDNAEGQGDPSLTPSGDHLYFSDTDLDGQYLAMSARTGSGDAPFAAEVVTPFATIMADGAAAYADPSISGDELVLVFTEYNDIVDSVFYATRSSTAEPFGSAQPISVAHGSAFNDDGQLSADGCTLYFASGRLHDDIQRIFVTTISP
jgi:hypothetical protein